MPLLYCKLCDQFVETDKMRMISNWSRGKATFRDGQVAHIVYSEKISARYTEETQREAVTVAVSPAEIVAEASAPSPFEVSKESLPDDQQEVQAIQEDWKYEDDYEQL